jgi:hypothetical protein
VAAGTIDGTVHVDGEDFTPSGLEDVFLARFAGGDGTKIWAKTHGTAGLDGASAIAADSHGDVFITGLKSGQHTFVAKYSAEDGHELWTRDFADQSYYSGPFGYDVDVDPDDNVIVTVSQDLSDMLDGVDFGSGLISGHFYVARFTPDGDLISASGYGKFYDVLGQANAVVAGLDGTAVVTGTYNGKLVFGERTLTSLVTKSGDSTSDIFLAKVIP